MREVVLPCSICTEALYVYLIHYLQVTVIHFCTSSANVVYKAALSNRIFFSEGTVLLCTIL